MEKMSNSITPDEFEKWKIKRRGTYRVYLLQLFEIGISFTVIATVQWEYLKVVPGSNKRLLYGILACVHNIPPIAFNVFILKWLDKTRRSKEFIIFINIISTTGHILFSLPYSPYLLIVGRFLDGFMLTLEPIMNSEIARSYPSDKLLNVLPLQSFSTMIGYAVGPLLALIFGNVNIRVRNFHISWGNSCSLMLLSLNILQMIFVSCYGHNLSLEFDLKESMCQCEYNGNGNGNVSLTQENTEENSLLLANDDETEVLNGSNNAEPNSNIADSTKEVILNLITQFDLALILFISFYSELSITVLYRIFPVMILDRLNYTKTTLSVFFTAYSIIFMSGIYFFARKNLQNKTAAKIGIIGFINLFIEAICVLFISPELQKGVNVTLLVVIALTFAVSELGESFFVSVTFAKMSSSKNQGVADGVREVFRSGGAFIGDVFALYIYQFISYSTIVHCATIVVILSGMIWKWTSFINPTIKF